jgi:hypothetical protein
MPRRTLDTRGKDKRRVDVALCVRFSPDKGTKDDHQHRCHGSAPHLLDYPIKPSRERYQWTGGDMFGNKPEQ